MTHHMRKQESPNYLLTLNIIYRELPNRP